MKTLLLLRHGQAERFSDAGDKGRALTEHGAEYVAAVGQKLLEGYGCPGVIVASDAARAQQTAEIVAQAVGFRGEIETAAAIYEATVADLLAVVAGLPDSAACALLVGHNPGLEQLAGALDREAAAPPALSPAALIALHLDVTRWRDARPGSGRAGGFLTPEHSHRHKGT